MSKKNEQEPVCIVRSPLVFNESDERGLPPDAEIPDGQEVGGTPQETNEKENNQKSV